MNGKFVRIEPCPPEARVSALHVLYQRVPESLRQPLVDEVLNESEAGLTDLSGLWVAWDRPWKLFSRRSQTEPVIRGAMLTQKLAARSAAVWAPEVLPSFGRVETAALLVRTVLKALRAEGVRTIQAVLDESAGTEGTADLIRGGLPRVTELLYMERPTNLDLAIDPPAPSPPPIDWRSFRETGESEFRRILELTYEASLDMPELDTSRSLDDLVASHQATGRFVPDRWRIGFVPGEPDAAAILLLSDIPEKQVWEVVYLGLSPAARGRGIGRAAIAHAIELARPHAGRIELAVDLRNRPATRLYRATGFTVYNQRTVHLAVYPDTEAVDRPHGPPVP